MGDQDPAPSSLPSTHKPVNPPTDPPSEAVKDVSVTQDAEESVGATEAMGSSLSASGVAPEQPMQSPTAIQSPMDLEKASEPNAVDKGTKADANAPGNSKEDLAAVPPAENPPTKTVVQPTTTPASTSTDSATVTTAKVVLMAPGPTLKGKEEAAPTATNTTTLPTGAEPSASPAVPLSATKKRKLPPPVPVPPTTATPSTITTTNKPPGVTQLLQDMPIVQQVTMDLLALLQSYGPLTAGQLDYNLPPKLSSYSATSSSLLQDILQVLVAVGLVQIVKDSQPPRYGLTRGLPRADVVMPWSVLQEIQAAHTEASRSAARCQRLVDALQHGNASSAKEVLKKLLLEYPEIMQDPVYLTALRNCHVDVAAVERERRMPEGVAKKKPKVTAQTTPKTTTITPKTATVAPKTTATLSAPSAAATATATSQPTTTVATSQPTKTTVTEAMSVAPLSEPTASATKATDVGTTPSINKTVQEKPETAVKMTDATTKESETPVTTTTKTTQAQAAPAAPPQPTPSVTTKEDTGTS